MNNKNNHTNGDAYDICAPAEEWNAQDYASPFVRDSREGSKQSRGGVFVLGKDRVDHNYDAEESWGDVGEELRDNKRSRKMLVEHSRSRKAVAAMKSQTKSKHKEPQQKLQHHEPMDS